MFATKLTAMVTALVFALTMILVTMPQPAEAMHDHWERWNYYIHYYGIDGSLCHFSHYEWSEPISSYHYNTSGQHGYGGNLAHHESHGQTIVRYVNLYETVHLPHVC